MLSNLGTIGLGCSLGSAFKTPSKNKTSNVALFVLDLARDTFGRWWLVEINDGQMSGLSTIDSTRFYKNLRFQLDLQNIK